MNQNINTSTSTDKIAVISFYSFITIPNIEIILPKILLIGKKKYVKGTVLIAGEGFNGSLSGEESNVRLVIEELIKLTKATDINIKTNYCAQHPFIKLKVKLKKEIITMGFEDMNAYELKGNYIETHNWDQFISQEDVILIDTRNDYEVEIGTFKNAIDPKTSTFREFPIWAQNNQELFKNKKIAMCCTGGVRCEKSTAYLKLLGYNEVYHLRGGILQYLEDTKNKNGLWKGECFVFDERRAVDPVNN